MLAPKGVQLNTLMITSINVAQDERSAWVDKMKAVQEAQLNQLRQETSTLSQTLKANTDNKVAKVLGDGKMQADQIRSQADLEVTQIYAQAYNQDPNFYEFFHNLQLYKKVLSSKQDVLVLSTQTPFFKSLAPSLTESKP